MLYADIIVDISHESLDKTYQYKIPEHLYDRAKIGMPVEITFGNGNRKIQGYIVGLSEQPKIEEHRIKDIANIPENGVPIESRMIALAHWMKENFGGTMNDALRTVLSVKKTVRPVEKKKIKLNIDYSTAEELLQEYAKKHYVAKVRLLNALLEAGSLSKELVTGKLNISAATIKSLEEAGVISTVVEEQYRRTKSYGKTEEPEVVLNEEQQNAVDAKENVEYT